MDRIAGYHSRLEPTQAQIKEFFEFAGVRKYAFNFAKFRKEDKYTRQLLSGERSIRNVFELRRIASLREGLETSYEENPEGVWVFKIKDLARKDECRLTIAEHGRQGDSKHPNPELGLAWLRERIFEHSVSMELPGDHFRQELPESIRETHAARRKLHPWVQNVSSLVFKDAEADLSNAFGRFFNPPPGVKVGYPKRDDGARKRFRISPGGAKAFDLVKPGESAKEAISRVRSEKKPSRDDLYVERSGIRHEGPLTVYGMQGIQVEVDRIRIPGLKSGGGWVRLTRKGYVPRQENTKYSQLVVSEHAGHWYVSVTCRVTVSDPKHRTGEVIGVDVGSRNLMVDSNAKVYGSRRNLAEESRLQRKIERLGRKVSRQTGPVVTEKGAVVRVGGRPVKQTPSNGWKRTQKQLAKVHKRLADMRNDARHQATRRLVDTGASLLRLEDLDVKQMLAKLPTGTAYQKRMRKINAKIGLGEIRRQVEYKATWAGAASEALKPHYTSKQHHECGKIHFNLGSREILQCDCGIGVPQDEVKEGYLPSNHRDVNAARNLRDYERFQSIRDSAWANRHTSKVLAGSEEPTSTSEVNEQRQIEET